MGSEDVVARARGCVGVRFRAHGRDPRFGLDCAGVASIAFGRDVAADYPLRSGDAAAIAARIDAAGLRRIAPPAAGAGALLLIDEGRGQHHLAVRTAHGFVHAHAGLRRVVETPGAPAGIVLGAWIEGD